MDQYQFYPTTPALARKAWKLFKTRSVTRALDPSAGAGDLLAASPDSDIYRTKFDAIEIDARKHEQLRARGITVVGLDFEDFGSAACYSHIIMNPPFAKGCAHTLHAWNTLFDGEIVAILNAETIRNPFSKERQLLASTIERHGTVEFMFDAFNGPDSERRTNVEIALVYLRKSANTQAIVGDLLKDLKADNHCEPDLAAELPLSIPANHVENTVMAFNAAVEALRQEAHARARSTYYANLLGGTLSERNGNQLMNSPESTIPNVREVITQGRDRLKNAAWSSILHSSQVRSKLSSGTMNRLESEFDQIKKLEFTAANVYGFLSGICSSGWDLQVEMACEVFDLVTKYHSENAVHYMGWKSNSRHRTCGMRMRATRFILPTHQTETYERSLKSKSERVLSDIDKVFAMLDGKPRPEVSLTDVFSAHFDELRAGARVHSSYFSVRYHPKIGTIHFFPTDKKLIDRLNRIVGQHRQWLPPVTENASNGFWAQFEQADSLDAEIRTAFQEEALRSGRSSMRVQDAFANLDSERAQEILSTAIATVLERHQIDFASSLGSSATLALEMA